MKPTQRLLVLLSVWAALAGIFAATGLPQRAPQGAVPVVVLTLTVLAITASFRIGWLREAVRGLSTRTLLSAHLLRFVGVAFLFLHAAGRLPEDFAKGAGWGDIAAAVGAAVLMLWTPGRGFRGALFAWNIFGVLDLIFAIVSATRNNLRDADSMNVMVTLPLALVPLFLVPLLLAAHTEIFRRIAAWRNG